MSPALTDAPNEAVCKSCMTILDGRGLKCTKCQSFIHVSCSELPEYLLVRYAVSSIQYCCKVCCKNETGEERYPQEISAIQDLKEKEKQIILQATAENENSEIPKAEENGIDQETISGSQNRTQEVATSTNKSNDVCRFFLQKRCKEGIKGEKCHYQHPRICFKWQRNGSDRGGCKKENCSFFHPKLCHQSLKQRKCFRKSCKFYHLNGTKTYDQLHDAHQDEGNLRLRPDYLENHGEGRAFGPPSNANRTDVNPRPMFVPRGTQQSRIQVQDRPRLNQQVQDDSLKRDFLEFKAEIMEMFTKLRQETNDRPPISILQRGREQNCHCTPL